MAIKSGSLDYWRDYFRTANSDIFDIIDHAILVAASDCPKEFRLRRDRIAERLFSCRMVRCSGCHREELAVPDNEEEEEEEDGGCRSGFDRDGGEYEGGGVSKESKINSSRDDHGEMNMNQVCNYSYGEAEALTDEIEEQSQIVGEVLRIREILYTSEEESDSDLYDSLRRLELMDLNVDTLKATEIGKTVYSLRKHGSKQIRQLAQTLVEGWRSMVDEWFKTTTATSGSEEGTPDSVNPSVVDEEEGLPSPPLDEGAFFAAQTIPMELSQFFDGMDDDGNPRNNGEFTKNRENERKPSAGIHSITRRTQHMSTESKSNAKENMGQRVKKQDICNGATVIAKGNNNQQVKKNEANQKMNKVSNFDSGPGRPSKLSMDQRPAMELKIQQKVDKLATQKKPLTQQQEKFKSSDEVAVQLKLEATKRKLQERYQQAENAKKQRTIQVMELHDLPKQGLGHRNPHSIFGNRNRHWGHGRR